MREDERTTAMMKDWPALRGDVSLDLFTPCKHTLERHSRCDRNPIYNFYFVQGSSLA